MNLHNEKDRTELINRINTLGPDSKGNWGKMNVNQMLCHCSDAIRGSLGELGALVDQSSFISRNLIKPLVLYVIPIPKDVPTSKRVDQVNGTGTPPTDFESDRETLITLVERLAATPSDFEFGRHFKFGAMNRNEWGIMGAKHIDHHLKQFGV
jgi:hypothetical protein